MTGRDGLKLTTPSDRDLVMTREFAAPRELVFDAWTRPELLRRWYGPIGWTLVVCEVDLCVGGDWRFVIRRTDGTQMEQHGVYLDIVRPERLVMTQMFGDEPASRAVVTMSFAETADRTTGQSGRTTLTSATTYETASYRDSMVRAGVGSGVGESYDRLDHVLAALTDRPTTDYPATGRTTTNGPLSDS